MAKTSVKGKAAGSYRSVGTTYDGVKVIKPKTKPTHFTAAQVKSAVAKAMKELEAGKKAGSAKKGNIFVEPRPQGDYAVKRSNAKRASDVLPTQTAAVARAKELQPQKAPLVKRVRNTKKGASGKWRKA